MRINTICGFQQVTAATLASATTITPVEQAGTGLEPTAAIMSVSTTAIRYTDDGVTTPTAAIGIRLPAGIAPFLYQGNLDNFKAILESGTPTLDIMYVVTSD
jgi:hypothetical protein